MDFYYYSFLLRDEERIFYTDILLDNQEDILQWALRFNFIQETDIFLCSNVRLLSPDEVIEKNKIMYREWWEKHKNDVSLCGKIPPTIGEVLLC